MSGRVAARASASVAQARTVVTRMALEMIQAVRDIPEDERPSGFTVEFGVGFTAEGNATVAKAGASGALKVTMQFGSAETPQ
ncbi:CU044_2847 family protein [Streptomyces sp. NPDC002306]